MLQIRIILEEQTLPGEAKPFRMARDVYKSCMDVGKIEELGLQPIKNILNELGGWPVLLGPNQTWDGGDNYIWVQSISLLNNFDHQIYHSNLLIKVARLKKNITS